MSVSSGSPGSSIVLPVLISASTLDVGHAHVNGNLVPFLKQGGAIHVHLHDNCGSRDDHLACGEGSIDFGHVMAALPPDATKVIEPVSFQQYGRSLEHLRTILP
jgi:Sugar phosphate isomerases/epimerases